MTYTPYDEDLEEENARLREEVAQLKAAQAWSASGAPRATAPATTDDAEWSARIRAATSPEEVMAIVDEQEQAREHSDPSAEEMDVAREAYHAAVAQASSPTEAAALEQQFLRANPWAMDE